MKFFRCFSGHKQQAEAKTTISEFCFNKTQFYPFKNIALTHFKP